MRLSEAIRAGSLRGPQLFRAFVFQRLRIMIPPQCTVASCALGAAALGSGWAAEQDQDPYEGPCESIPRWLEMKWPRLTAEMASCPVCPGTPTQSLASNIVHLNDAHRWSRETIADWVEGRENALFARCVPEPVAVATSDEVVEEELVCV